jgi:hypothetical protein
MASTLTPAQERHSRDRLMEEAERLRDWVAIVDQRRTAPHDVLHGACPLDLQGRTCAQTSGPSGGTRSKERGQTGHIRGAARPRCARSITCDLDDVRCQAGDRFIGAFRPLRNNLIGTEGYILPVTTAARLVLLAPRIPSGPPNFQDQNGPWMRLGAQGLTA